MYALFLRGCFLVAAFMPDCAFALNPDEKPASYIVSHWDVEDGLPNNSIKQLVQTRDGYLWIGTPEGLARFDGLAFTVFNRRNTPAMKSHRITTLAETGDGSLWIGTSSGLVRYHDRQFTAYNRTNGLKSDTINALCVAPDGSLWIGGRDGVTRWVDGKFVNDIDTSAYDTLGMRVITLDRHGAIWLTTGTQALRYQSGAFTAFGRPQGLPAETIVKIIQDAEGRTLAVTQGGLFRLEDDRFVPFEQNGALASPSLTRAIADRAGNLWIGSAGGLDRYSHGKMITYADRFGDKLGVVDALLEDREGCLWIGSSVGLYRLTDRRAHSLSEEDGVSGGLVAGVRQTRDGSLWISSWSRGVDHFQNGKVTHYTLGSPLSFETVTYIYEAPNGTMWLGNRRSSIDRLEGNKVTTYIYQPGVSSSRPVTALFTDNDGNLLVGIDNRGLLQLHEGRIIPVREGSVPDRATVWSFFRTRDDRLLIGTSDGLYERHADRSWHLISLSNLKHPVIARDFLEDADGGLWLATDGHGLVHWKDGQVRAYGSREGVVNDTLFSVLDDGRGALWVSSASGIGRIRKSEFAKIDSGAITVVDCMIFGRTDGLLSGSAPGIGGPAGIRLTDGRLVFATDRGAAVVDPQRLQVNTQPPTVVIESILADDQLLSANGEITIAPGVGRLEIRYTALSLIEPQRLRFRYKLEGSDPHWVEAGRDRRANYTHLKPGHYTFRVMACNSDGVWDETGATLRMTLLPKFYQTLWFRLAAVVLLVSVVVLLIRARLRQLNERQEVLKRMNAELDQRIKERTTELADTYKNLIEVSRQAGMAEVATNVLHNVGNVLNSVNVSANLVAERAKKSKTSSLAKVVTLLNEHEHDLGAFFTSDPRGKQLPGYLSQLSDHLLDQQRSTVTELDSLRGNIDHIKEIVAMQQNYARVSGVKEMINVVTLVEDSLRMSEGALSRHGVEVIRDFAVVPPLNVEKHKILQILVNVIRNAEHACQDSTRADKRLTVRVAHGDGLIKISVMDNGVGILPENLTRIFNHGFTTKKDGHGFGLHSGALAAKEMGGSLTVNSEGPGKGANFTLELPVKHESRLE